MLEVSLVGVGPVLRLEGMGGQWSNDKGKHLISTPLPAYPLLKSFLVLE